MTRTIAGLIIVLASAGGAFAQVSERKFDDALGGYVLSRSPQVASAGETDAATVTDAVDDDATRETTWLAMGSQLAAADTDGAPTAAETESSGPSYVPWRERRGPAYPGDFWKSFGRDLKELPATIWDDTKYTFTDTGALITMGAAVAAGVAVDVANWNGCAGDHYSKNGSQLNGFWDEVGEVGGNPGTHFGVAGAMYFASLAREDVKNYEISKTLINALALNGAVTLALKGVAHSDAPNGDPFGWPSGHTSSTFTLATVLHEAYGPWVGVPMFGFATFVGYERVDARNHDLNDVVSGALIGIAIGHAVYQNHEQRIMGFEVLPFADSQTGAMGLALGKQW